MSHVVKCNFAVTDIDTLARAVETLGCELVKGQTSYKWFGRSVGDYPLPKGFTAEDLGKCDHAIRIPGHPEAYEIGVVRAKDGSNSFTLLWDFWQGGFGMEEKVGQDATLLHQAYTAQTAMDYYNELGYSVSMTRQENGELVLEAMR